MLKRHTILQVRANSFILNADKIEGMEEVKQKFFSNFFIAYGGN